MNEFMHIHVYFVHHNNDYKLLWLKSTLVILAPRGARSKTKQLPWRKKTSSEIQHFFKDCPWEPSPEKGCSIELRVEN